MIQLGEHFSSDDRSRHSEWLLRRQWFIKARYQQERQRGITEKLDDEILSLATEAVMATEMQIEEFKVKLDTYDEATVFALMENQEQLDAVNAQILAMLERAYVMDDGRRVFKTEDGTQVFDEQGTEVTRDELDFDLISPSAPTWEQRMELLGKRDQLTTERKQILEFDKARENVAEGKISSDELDELDSELSEAAPPLVKKQMPGYSAADSTPNAKATFTAIANPTGIVPTATPEQAPVFDPMR